MPFTDVNFAFNSLTQQEKDSETGYLAECITAGVTDGTYIEKWVSGLTVIQRTWTTQEAAEAYVEFINTFAIKPQLVEILGVDTVPKTTQPMIDSPNGGEPEPDKHPGMF
jgi:hypothetical protein